MKSSNIPSPVLKFPSASADITFPRAETDLLFLV